jgi:hypothetical protein
MAAGEAGGVVGNPGKTTRDELEERVGITMHLLDKRVPKHRIKKVLANRFGVGYRTVERYMARARKQIIAASGKSKKEHRLEALRFYESVITGPDATLRERMDAQSEICKLLGLNAPTRLRHGGDRGAPPIETKGEVVETVAYTREDAQRLEAMTVDELKQIHDLYEQVDARLATQHKNGQAANPRDN